MTSFDPEAVLANFKEELEKASHKSPKQEENSKVEEDDSLSFKGAWLLLQELL